jgi:hypothetical protein
MPESGSLTCSTGHFNILYVHFFPYIKERNKQTENYNLLPKYEALTEADVWLNFHTLVFIILKM